VNVQLTNVLDFTVLILHAVPIRNTAKYYVIHARSPYPSQPYYVIGISLSY